MDLTNKKLIACVPAKDITAMSLARDETPRPLSELAYDASTLSGADRTPGRRNEPPRYGTPIAASTTESAGAVAARFGLLAGFLTEQAAGPRLPPPLNTDASYKCHECLNYLSCTTENSLNSDSIVFKNLDLSNSVDSEMRSPHPQMRLRSARGRASLLEIRIH